MVAPIMDDLADLYKGKVIIYKVNTDKERELASIFQINSIPAILFSPQAGKPAIQPGALTKQDYIKIIDEFLLKKKSEKS
jgi:thioredoxin-like negative regulator of GroEL